MWLIFLELGIALALRLVVGLALRQVCAPARARDDGGDPDDQGTR